MWTLQGLLSDKPSGRLAPTLEVPGARARVVADEDGGVRLISQQLVPELQHLLAHFNKSRERGSYIRK